MATRALTLRVHLLGQNFKKRFKKKYIYIFFGGPNKFVKHCPLIRSNTVYILYYSENTSHLYRFRIDVNCRRVSSGRLEYSQQTVGEL